MDISEKYFEYFIVVKMVEVSEIVYCLYPMQYCCLHRQFFQLNYSMDTQTRDFDLCQRHRRVLNIIMAAFLFKKNVLKEFSTCQ